MAMISFLIQIWGVKTVYLYSPDQYKLLNPVETYNNYQPCLFDPDHISSKDDSPKAIVAKIIPGDLLLIPTGWYHCVRAHGITFSVSRALHQKLAELLSTM